MGIEFDPSAHLTQFAHPQSLVTNAWLGAKLGSPGLKVIECNAEPMLYDIGHIPTAIRLRWDRDLSDPLIRDVIGPEDFAALMDATGISRDDTVVFYGDQGNLWAVYALWVFELYGHPDVRLLDGGRDAWMTEEREITYDVPVPTPPSSTSGAGYPVVERDDSSNRIFVDELRGKIAGRVPQLIDLRDDDAYSAGHIPSAMRVDAARNFFPNARFRQADSLAPQGLSPYEETIVYCDNGARAAQEWFVLHHLLNWTDVRVYDGSWIEWGSMMRLPIRRSTRDIAYDHE